MSFRLAVLAASFAFVACGGGASSPCGNKVCPADQTCDAATGDCMGGNTGGGSSGNGGGSSNGGGTSSSGGGTATGGGGTSSSGGGSATGGGHTGGGTAATGGGTASTGGGTNQTGGGSAATGGGTAATGGGSAATGGGTAATGGGSAATGGGTAATGGGSAATGGGTAATGGGTAATGGGTAATGGGTAATGGGTAATGGGTAATGGGTAATGGGTAATGGGTAATGGGTATDAGRVITILAINHYVGATTSDVPIIGTQTPTAIAILADGGQVTYSGSWVDAGIATIPGVPAGRLLINFSDVQWVDTTHDTIDVGADIGGRSTAVFGAANTTVEFKLTNLSPWLDTDGLEYVVPNTHSDYTLSAADAGATSNDQIYDWENIELAIPGDTVTLLQNRYSAVTAPGSDAGFVFSYSPQTSVQVTNLSYINAFDNAVAAAFNPVVRTQVFALDWRRAQLDAYASLVNGTFATGSVSLSEIPFNYSAGHGYLNVGGGVIIDTVFSVDDADTHNTTASVPYAPITGYPIVGEVDAEFTRDYPLIGGGNTTLAGLISTINSMPSFGSGAQTAILSPPTGLTVGGSAATGVAALSTSLTTPVIAWSAPTGAIGYYVFIMRVFNDSTNTPTSETSVILFTDQTKVSVPSNVLVSGNRYAIIVRAVTEPTGDPINTPFRRGSFPFGLADLLSSPIVIP